MTTIGFAGDWKLTDSFSSTLTTVDRSGAGSSSGTVLKVSPGFTLNGRGGRIDANINYKLNATEGTGSTDPKKLSHDLNARGNVEAVENLLNIGMTARAKLEGNSAISGFVDSINGKSDGSQSFSASVSPVLRGRLGREAEIVSSNSVDYVTHGGSNNSSSTRTTLNLGASSGAAFGALGWDAGVTRRQTDYDARTDKNTAATAGVSYKIDRSWAVSAHAGYENNDVDTSRNDTDGVTWNTGVVWTPNARTNLNVVYGQRYFGNTYQATLAHRTRKTNMTLDVSRSVTSRRTTRLLDSQLQLSNSTGTSFFDENPDLEETDEDFLNTAARGVVTVSGQRTSMTFSGNISKREYEVSGNEEDSYGVSVRASRQLDGNLSASLGASYSHANDTSDGDSDNYNVTFSLSHSLSKKSSVSLDLQHREQDSNSSYTENRIGVSFKTSFL